VENTVVAGRTAVLMCPPNLLSSPTASPPAWFNSPRLHSLTPWKRRAGRVPRHEGSKKVPKNRATFSTRSDKGARHRSAAYCATLLPGSVAMTVSQDGAITIYRKPLDGGPVEETELLL
jgi:hypothetical protein